mmetsp:Transcript_53738/g.156162  ORF Transcript_53738/g.156162 Transcript_53738/m.156162 type:complete len:236 (-) Transcript_53738:310-1017(-)
MCRRRIKSDIARGARRTLPPGPHPQPGESPLSRSRRVPAANGRRMRAHETPQAFLAQLTSPPWLWAAANHRDAERSRSCPQRAPPSPLQRWWECASTPPRQPPSLQPKCRLWLVHGFSARTCWRRVGCSSSPALRPLSRRTVPPRSCCPERRCGQRRPRRSMRHKLRKPLESTRPSLHGAPTTLHLGSCSRTPPHRDDASCWASSKRLRTRRPCRGSRSKGLRSGAHSGVRHCPS